MKDIQKDLLQFCSEILYKKADFEELGELHWISFGYGEGESYCYECCEKEVDKINKELIAKGEITVDEDGDIRDDDGAFVDGGWGGIDEDGCAFCEICNKRLDASLTQYGVESEVDHFLSFELVEIGNDIAIELYYIFECSGYFDFSEKYEKDLLKLANIVLSYFDVSMGIESRFDILDIR